ncbi:MAG: sporulation transcriptional regulator SpoIIID [Clostridia bacterium]|nr:sporulation transcriptional regulator SpoIIID [Clostridia bacterium]
MICIKQALIHFWNEQGLFHNYHRTPSPFAPTAHKDVTERLEKINPALYRQVSLVLKQNKDERHLRGGEATKQKYIQLQSIKSTRKKEG